MKFLFEGQRFLPHLMGACVRIPRREYYFLPGSENHVSLVLSLICASFSSSHVESTRQRFLILGAERYGHVTGNVKLEHQTVVNYIWSYAVPIEIPGFC